MSSSSPSNFSLYLFIALAWIGCLAIGVLAQNFFPGLHFLVYVVINYPFISITYDVTKHFYQNLIKPKL